MKIGIAYALPKRQTWISLEMPAGTTIREAIGKSGILEQFPDIDLERQKVGVFGKVSTLDTPLAEGDRVEIYRPLVADPKTIKSKVKGGADGAEGG